VAIAGGVQFPGHYAAREGLTAQKLIDLAGGPREGALLNRLTISQKSIDGKRSYRSISGSAIGLELLGEGDSVLVPTEGMFRKEFDVTVRGEVMQPGALSFGPGLTLYDVLMLAGGFTGDADTANFEIARLSSQKASLRRSEVFKVSLTESKTYLLKAGDAVSVRYSRDRVTAPSVEFIGEVEAPGAYGLISPFEDFESVLKRANGLTPFADPNGVYLVRQSSMVLGDTALDGSSFNVVKGEAFRQDTIALSLASVYGRRRFYLQDGDQIHVLSRQTTVRLAGAVFQPSIVSHSGSYQFLSYISQAGGHTEVGDPRKAYVIYPNGAAKRSRNYVLWVNRPKVVPGSTVVVPEKAIKTSRTSPAEVAAIGGILASMTTLIVTLITLL
jgi:protein involved in polysaccharide export with SLBB domain